MIKKRIIITSTISLILVAILMIGSTYSIFTSTKIDENANVYKTGVLDVTYTLSEDNITLANSVPMTEEEADGIWPYRITVTNNGTVPYQFDVILNDTTSSSSNTIDNKYIMTKVGYLQPKTLNECTNNIIKEDVVLLAGESVNIDVRIWVDKSITNSELGKSFYAKLSIDGLAVYNDNTDINNDALSLKYMKTLFTSESDTSYFKNSAYKTYIKEASFVNYIDTTNAITGSDGNQVVWDLSLYEDNTVVGWLEFNEEDSSKYNLYIGASRPIYTKSLICFFAELSAIIDINFDNLDTSMVESLVGTFGNCENLTNLDLSSFDTSRVISMSNMFHKCLNLVDLDISSFNTKNVVVTSGAFYYCKSLTELDVSSFDTSNVTDMQWMFAYCKSLTQLNVDNFDTSKVTTMRNMFYWCENLISLDLTSFDTSKVTDMQYMFGRNPALVSIDLSSFNTSKVTNMLHMFQYCNNLTNLDLSSFDTSSVTTMQSMFRDCFKLTTTITIRNNSTIYTDMFYQAAIQDGASITVNYTSATSSLVDNMILTKPDTSNVVKGSLVS